MAETLATDQFSTMQYDAVQGECESVPLGRSINNPNACKLFIRHSNFNSLSGFPAHYDRIAEKYDDYMFYWYEPITKVVVKHLDIKPEDRVADVGAGTAGVAHRLWKRAGQRARG